VGVGTEKRLKPSLECVQPVLMSRDVLASIDFYVRLGFTLAGQDVPGSPRYARLSRDNVELDLQWHDAREWDYPNDRPSYRFVVDDVNGLHQEFSASGISEMTPVEEKPWGTLEFHVRDHDNNLCSFTGGYRRICGTPLKQYAATGSFRI
jgi:catechol 2,3-dioxygenase-like lactoylglutathione lyase family enzyme